MQESLKLPPLSMAELILDRGVALELGLQTQSLVAQGWYINQLGVRVDIAAARDAARYAKVVYRPGMVVPQQARSTACPYQTEVYNNTTLAVAQARAAQGHRVAVVNFASATSPGGGWLTGSRAQEESLARSSSLVYALRDDEWYRNPQHWRNPFYDDTVIVTPQVPFFRMHMGQLLDQPWPADVITSAAVHAKAVRKYMPERMSEIPLVMAKRARVVLQAAAALRADVLVLGAWGCGAFGNSPDVIAAALADAMQQVDLSTYAHIDFAVADLRTPPEVLAPFMRRWGK